MIPASRHSSLSSLVPLDLNKDQSLDPFTPNHNQLSSFSSLSYPNLFNPPQQGSFYWQPDKHLPSDEKAEEIVPSGGSSWDHSEARMQEPTVWKKEGIKDEDGCSRKMIVSDIEEPFSPVHHNSVRVCSDCHTTKTPLWRSGPRGPKSLCNACGIRQRKARRAAAMAAASANGTILVPAETSMNKGNKIGNKDKKSRIECVPQTQLKKKRRVGVGTKQSHQGTNKLGFDDLALRLSKNLALQQVFPQDEIKEAAILLMALSYGLVHG